MKYLPLKVGAFIFASVMVVSFSASGKRYIVTFLDRGAFTQSESPEGGGSSHPGVNQLVSLGIRPVKVLARLGIVIIDIDVDAHILKKLKSHSGLIIEEDKFIPPPSVGDPKKYVPIDIDKDHRSLLSTFHRPWGLDRIEAPKAWEKTKGEGVKVLVLDSGIDRDHPEFEGRFLKGKSFVGFTPGTPYDYFDKIGHGTHTAGTALGQSVGVAPAAELLVGKVCHISGCSMAAILEGIDWGVTEKVDVINLSVGSSQRVSLPPHRARLRALEEAERQGIVIVAASGNQAENPRFSKNPWVANPSDYSTVISVGSVDQRNKRAPFSQYGPGLSIVAPGVAIKSSYPGKSYFAELFVSSDGEGDFVNNVMIVGSGLVKNLLTAPMALADFGRQQDMAQVDLQSKIVLVDRGRVYFYKIVEHAIRAGAVGLIIADNGMMNQGIPIIKRGGQVSIPVVLINQNAGMALKRHLADGVALSASIHTGSRPNYVAEKGTSMSSPHVAGVVALIKSANPYLTAQKVRSLIERTATPIGPVLEYGKGLVNANKAVTEAIAEEVVLSVAN